MRRTTPNHESRDRQSQNRLNFVEPGKSGFEPETIARYRVALVREEATPYESPEQCGDPAAAARFLHTILSSWDREVMGALFLDTRNRAIGHQLAYIGTLTRAAVEQRLETLRQRKERVVSAYLYEGAIDKETYQAHLARVEEELTLARIDRHDTEIDEFDIEGTLAFAEHLVNESSRLWIEAGLAQRQRLQKLFFPSGLSYDGEELRTPLTCPFFNHFEGTSGQARRMVAQTVGNSNTKWDSNTLFAWLHEVAALRQAA